MAVKVANRTELKLLTPFGHEANLPKLEKGSKNKLLEQKKNLLFHLQLATLLIWQNCCIKKYGSNYDQLWHHMVDLANLTSKADNFNVAKSKSNQGFENLLFCKTTGLVKKLRHISKMVAQKYCQHDVKARLLIRSPRKAENCHFKIENNPFLFYRLLASSWPILPLRQIMLFKLCAVVSFVLRMKDTAWSCWYYHAATWEDSFCKRFVCLFAFLSVNLPDNHAVNHGRRSRSWLLNLHDMIQNSHFSRICH